MDNEKEISFGAFDSELMRQEIFIPEGFTATIDGNKIILTRIENEDGRIRKELIGYIVKEVGLYPGEDRKEHKWLRWLEKQGEQKPTDEDMKEALRTEYEKGRADAFVQMQKEWSEEDEKMVKCCEIALEAFEKLGKNTQGFPHENYFELDEEKIYPSEVNRWLKFLSPQPKQEWGEEDEVMINRIRSIVEKYAFSQSAVDVNGDLCEKEYIDTDNWLKSLKERYFWKPSDDQMRALEYIINNASNTSYSCKIAKGLLEQLKKLKGE